MNNSIEQIMDVINDKVGDYISDGMYQDLKSDITFALAEKDKEIERLGKRDGRAGIELCYDDGNNPFARSECKVVDFGVCDNHYVIESELLNKTLSEAKGWRGMCSRMDMQLRDLLMSAESEWENKRLGHDWAEACESTRELLAAYNAMKDRLPTSELKKEAGK